MFEWLQFTFGSRNLAFVARLKRRGGATAIRFLGKLILETGHVSDAAVLALAEMAVSKLKCNRGCKNEPRKLV